MVYRFCEGHGFRRATTNRKNGGASAPAGPPKAFMNIDQAFRLRTKCSSNAHRSELRTEGCNKISRNDRNSMVQLCENPPDENSRTAEHLQRNHARTRHSVEEIEDSSGNRLMARTGRNRIVCGEMSEGGGHHPVRTLRKRRSKHAGKLPVADGKALCQAVIVWSSAEFSPLSFRSD